MKSSSVEVGITRRPRDRPRRETPAGVWYGPVRPPELDGADAPAEAAAAEAVREAIGDEGARK